MTADCAALLESLVSPGHPRPNFCYVLTGMPYEIAFRRPYSFPTTVILASGASES